MRASIILIASVLIIFLGIWGTSVIYFDQERLKSLVEAHVSAQTGRSLRIDGPVSLRWFPRLMVTAENITLSGPGDYQGPDLLTAEHLELSFRYLPLIRGRAEGGRILLDQARLNVHRDSAGRSSVDGLIRARRDLESDSPADAARGQRIRLSNVSVVISDADRGRRGEFDVASTELDEFSLDRSMRFQFSGLLGDPELFEWLEIDGLLNVASATGETSLSNLDLQGRLPGSGVPVRLLGNLTFQPGPPATLNVQPARLVFDGNAHDLQLAYQDGAPPQLSVTLAGQLLDLDVVQSVFTEFDPGALPLISAGEQPTGPGEMVIDILRGMTLTAELAFGTVRYGSAELGRLEARLDSQQGELQASPLVIELPGGVVEAETSVDFRGEIPQTLTSLRLETSSFDKSISALGIPALVDGAGTMSLDLAAAGLRPDTLRLSMVGSGNYEIWDGSLQGVDISALQASVAERDWTAAVRAGLAGRSMFRTMSGPLRLDAHAIELTSLNIVGDGYRIGGEVSVGLVDWGLAGRLDLVGDEIGRLSFRLGGDGQQPLIEPIIDDEALKLLDAGLTESAGTQAP